MSPRRIPESRCQHLCAGPRAFSLQIWHCNSCFLSVCNGPDLNPLTDLEQSSGRVLPCSVIHGTRVALALI